jgi:hypothetical protein
MLFRAEFAKEGVQLLCMTTLQVVSQLTLHYLFTVVTMVFYYTFRAMHAVIDRQKTTVFTSVF